MCGVAGGGSWYNNVGCIVENGILVLYRANLKSTASGIPIPAWLWQNRYRYTGICLILGIAFALRLLHLYLALGYLLLPTVSVSPPVLSECSVNMRITVLLPFIG